MSFREGHAAPSGGASSRKKATHRQSGIKVTRMIKGPQPSAKHTPSSYLAERRLTTEERLAQTREMYPPKIIELLDIGVTSHQKDVTLDVDQPLFQPFPSEVVFQQFDPHHTYEFPLALRNNDKVARQIKVTHEESPYFSLSCQRSVGTKVAPGMEITYHIIFTPDEEKDYDHQLVCITEREKFVIPVRAVGARALLDFPDEVLFSAAPVKYSSTKTVLVRNVGNKETKFSLETKHPFSVDPASATLAVNACMQVNINFVPWKVGDHTEELAIHYDTGEDVYTQLHGSAIDVNVRLDRSSVKMENTFIGLSSQRSVTLHNRSDVVVHYQWKAFSSESEEEMQRELRSQQLTEEESLSREAFFERCMHNPSIRDRLPILTRSLNINRKRYLDDERFLYADDNISIDPIEGDIWPNSQAEVSIIFQPEEAKSYFKVAYCDVTGRESRLPVKIRGEGLGPRLQFSFDTLDIQNVFVNSAHAYEVVLANKGDVEAVYALVPPESLFGPKFTFAPSSGMLQPGRFQAIQISFCSSVLGDFCEDFQWKVEGAMEPLKLKIEGVVIGPTFQFDVPQIKFGTISFGFLTSCEVTLSNTSEIPMTYHLRVPGEGGPTHDPEAPREFEIKPHKGTLPPNFHQTIRVNFTPTSVKSYSTALVVDVKEAGREVFSLPITAKSVVPSVTLLTPLLDFGRCFLHHPFVQNVELLNDSSLPVKYEMTPQVDHTVLVYSTMHPKGVIEPHTTLSIPLQVEAQLQGEIASTVVFNILGSTDSPLEVSIYCIGEGPVISVTPAQLEWGVCPVLTALSKKVTLSNESLIPAEFECALAREKTIFTVQPISAVIPPEEELELTVTAMIDDCLKFTDKLTIVVSQGVSFTVSLSAEGRGTTIVSHPALQPRVDLGPHFSRGPCQQQFTLMNRGRRMQALSWTTEGFSAAKLKRMEIERTSRDTRDVGLKHSQKLPELKKPLFQIIPNKFVLEPYQSQVVVLQGYSPKPQGVNERLICHAIIGKNPHKERIMTVDITAEFIAPLLEFTSQELLFRVYQPPGSKLTQHRHELGVRNVSPLTVTAMLMCGYPFSLLSRNTPLAQLELKLSPGEDSQITVQYDSTYCVDKHTRIEENYLAVAYREHPQRDCVTLKSEVYFPNVEFETKEVDFGCILNDTETIKYITMTNSSPLEVHYDWFFLKRPPVRRVDPEQQDEGVDMQSECESDSQDEEEEELEQEGSERLDESEEQYTTGQLDAGSTSGGSQKQVSLEGGSQVQEGELCVSQEGSQVDVHSADAEQEPSAPQENRTNTAAVTPPSEEQATSSTTEDQEVLESGLPAGESTVSVEREQKDSKSEEGSVPPSQRKKSSPQPWELVADPFTPISIEQVFDILPLHGVLLPGQSQQVQFTFYGHADIATEVTAACRLEGGPTYQIRLVGEASEVQHRFSRIQIDLGKQLYDQVQTAEIVLHNSGKVDLEFCAMGVGDSRVLTPKQISVSPTMGHILALESQKLTIRYLPGVPAKFLETFKIQVAHFEPDTITLTGEGIFPRISFSLPREMTNVDSEHYSSLSSDALANLKPAVKNSPEVQPAQNAHVVALSVPSKELDYEMERLIVQRFVQEHAERLYSGKTQGSKSTRLRPSLPEFHLDFSHVVYSQVVSRTVTLTNTGYSPVSFTTAHGALEHTGFSLDLGERIHSLPEFESLEFTVRFDPAAIRCPEGHVEARLPFNLVGGPSYSIRLSANVTRPSMQLSSTNLEFGTVTCGQCKIITIRLHNPYHVKCEWNAITDKPPKKIPKHIPLHVRKKMKEKPPPKYFEVDPHSGILLPGQKADVRVRFMPSEELHYIERIPFAIRQNTDNNLLLHVEGFGSEPQIQFDRTLVEFTPVLPFAPGTEAEVTVSNPMPYPVEFYSLEFDKQYLEEEEILRWLKDYDKQNRLFLPPTIPGGKLPHEILSAWEKEQKSKFSESELPSEPQVADSTVSVELPTSQAKLMAPTSSTNILPQHVGTYEVKASQLSTVALVSVPQLSVMGSLCGLSQAAASHPNVSGVEHSPVDAAIARYLGLDLSPEAALAENRQGIAIIIHGPPVSGRTTQAKALGGKYNAAVIVVDDILKDVISTASTPAGCKARELCMQAAQAKTEVQETPSNLSTLSKKHVSKEGAKEKDKDKDKDKEAPPELPSEFPEPPRLFPVQPLKGTSFAVPEGSLMPTHLPEELIVEILSDRLQQTDCRRGVVFDGVESQFTPSPINLALILRAIHNRKHIYFVHLEMELQAIKDRLEAIEKENQHKAEEEAQAKKAAEEREKERIASLLELEEDEYESLSEEQKQEIDRMRLENLKKKRLQKQREKDEKERLERDRREEEERRLEEERLRKKGKLRDGKAKASSNKPPAVVAIATTSRSESVASPTLQQPSQVNGGMGPGPTTSGASIMSGMETPGPPRRRHTLKALPKISGLVEELDHAAEENPLNRRYGFYNNSLDSLKSLLDDWDRRSLQVRPKAPPEPEEPQPKTITPSRKGKGRQKESAQGMVEQPEKQPTAQAEESREGVGVPLIAVDGVQSVTSITGEICIKGLPSMEEVLEGMGLGPSGPPVPGPVTFQVHPYPLKRRKLESTAHERFVFIATSPNDPNAEKTHKAPPEVTEEQHEPPQEAPSRMSKRERTGSVRSMESSDSASHRKSPQKPPTKKKSSLKAASPLPPQVAVTQEEHAGSEAELATKHSGPIKLDRFHWVIPAGGHTKLKLLFSSQDEGQFDQTLNFEISGTRRRYQLFCRGLSVVPTICREPRIVFPHRKKTLKEREIVQKRYVLSASAFIFGPLCCGKTRERYREGRYPENLEVLTISNTSLMETEVAFCFQHDHNATTFLLEPASMTLQPGESKTLTIWAYPKSPHNFKDSLVCCIKHNPDPVVFKISCDGVEPDLKVDKKILDFKKVLLHRKQTNILHLHNHTLLPVAWKLSGLEQLGDEFNFSQDHGIVQPKSEFPLHVNFRAAKPVNYTKKAFKIEISDVEQIMGLMHTENVQIQAEAYDVAMDVSFPRGADGGLDFQCIRVCDEQKLVVQLKNKGKYDIGFSFLFDVSSDGVDYRKMFTISPTHSTLYPGEKAQSVGVTFRANREITIKDQPIVKCQVIDTHVGEQGEVIANIPIHVSAQAVFSKFSISPINDINFGSMVVNTRKSCSFTLENKGKFEFRYGITKKVSAAERRQMAVNMAAVAAKTRTKSREGVSSARSSFVGKPTPGKGKTEGSLRTEVLHVGGSQRLVLGMFTVIPAMGIISAGQSQTINVDCVADKPGKHEEVLSIEISDRYKDDPPITYKICGEVFIPAINAIDVASIFEEHRVCSKLGVLGQLQFHEDGCVGVYGEEERRFVFKSVIVGQTSKARFKIINPNKIPCDVQVNVKPLSSKQKGNTEAFEVGPSSKITIPSHSHIFATVSFKPINMLSYSALFEAIPDGVRGKGLSFELQGEGNLPQMEVVKPTLRNAKGQPLLLFRRLLLSKSQAVPVTLKNTGTIPAIIMVETVSGYQSFSVVSPEATEEESCRSSDQLDPSEESSDQPKSRRGGKRSPGPPPVPIRLAVNETKAFSVVFRPSAAKKWRGALCLRIQDNQFENLPLQLVGEGYEDEVSIENIRGQLVEPAALEMEQLPEEIEATQENHLFFGGCPVGESRQATFTLSNHSSSAVFRFKWPDNAPGFTFTPQRGHLHPQCSKDITVIFKASMPVALSAQGIFGKLQKISFSQPLSQIADWDDRMKSVRWVNVSSSQLAVPPTDETLPGGSPGRPPATPAKKKVIETVEPPHAVVDDSHGDLELYATAVADYTRYECPVREIKFRETLMYQTRVYSFPVKNSGQIILPYHWEALDSEGISLPPHPSQHELHLNETGSVVSEGGAMMPFTITPSQGHIFPGEEASFTLRFSPLDALDLECRFKCNIPHLDSSCEPLELSVHGRSLMPYCHFDLEQSDYLSRRPADSRGIFGGSFDPASTRVIEFHSCGIGVKITKRFHIINPTSAGYEFSWTSEGGLSSTLTPQSFKCLTPRDFVAGGRKYEMVFEYHPSDLKAVESFWRFSIPSLSLSLSFLLVGHTTEPSVLLDRAYVNLKSMLVGSKAKETVYLLNNEASPYHFAIVERSCHCKGHTARLGVSPMSGVIQPHSKLPIDISFTATQEQEFNFNLQCSVRRKPSPLVLNVKAEGYAISTTLSYTSPDNNEVSLPVGRGARRIIDFGQVPVNERALGRLSIFNHGQYSFEYQWRLSEQCWRGGSQEGHQLVKVFSDRGVVEPHNRVHCDLTFSPPTKMALKGCEITLEIVNGPSLPISLRGNGVEPQVSFSFLEHDFGPSFLFRSGMPPQRTTLTITNCDKKDISMTCLFSNKPHLEVECEPTLLVPGESSTVEIEFRPRETMKYSELVLFEINGLFRKSVTVKGEGAPMKIELANPAQKVVNFGALRIGDEVSKAVKLVNHSPIPVTFSVSIVPSSSVPALQQEGVLAVSPPGEITMKPNGGECSISVTFHPEARVPQFSEEVTLECAGMSQPLVVVSGSCHGLEVTLDSDHLPFGAVVQHSQSSRRVLMMNSGDIGAKFQWEAEKFAPDFSISPVEGYISPGMEITFDIVFHPRELNHDIRYDKLPCHIEGREQPLRLTLSGVCIEQIPFKDVLHFTTHVRNKETRDLTLSNKSNTPWLLRPIIDGEYWCGPETLTVEPGQARHYDLTYHPLTMTTDTQKHQGSIFFPLPDGTGLLYNLLGTAEPPKHTGAISQEIPCKTSHTELLPVKNWLRRPQRFRVTTEMVRPEKLDRSVSLHGLDYIDVPALGKRDYKLHFYSFKEGSFLAKVTFRNEQTGEYLYYQVTFKSTPPGIMGTVELTTPVRKSTSHHITISNPLPSTITVMTNTNVSDISLPSSFIVGAQSEGKCMFEFLPLRVGETTGKLTLNTTDLGLYQYELHLVATPPPTERPVHFTTSLGSSQQQQCRFISYAKGRTEYTCKVDSSDFHVEKTITVASAGSSGTEATVEVTFEPSHLGDTHTTLMISSPSGGDYTIPLYGHCLVPKPQGPYVIKAGSSVSIPFKNVFTQTTQFSFTVDNPAFVVKASDNLKPRKTYNILVSYVHDAKQADTKPTVAKTGKLVVTSQRSAKSGGTRSHGGISWTYYLKGIAHS